MEPLKNGAEAPLLAVLRIDLIMWKLESFLELKDLRNMRLVSRAMNQVILCQTKFLSKSKLVLTKDVYENPCFKTISFRPKNLAFETIQVGSNDDVFLDQASKREEITQLVCKLVESCEYLEIRQSGWLNSWVLSAWSECRANPEDMDLDDRSLPEYFLPVLDVILSITNLKELRCCDSSQVILKKTTEEHEDALSSLKNLEFGFGEYGRLPAVSFYYIPPIFLKLKGLMTILGPRCGDYDESDGSHVRFRDLVVNNRKTLIELDLSFCCGFCCSKYFVNTFPFLKSLNLNQHWNWKRNYNPLVIQFLGNHIHQLQNLSYEEADGMEDGVWQVLSKCTVPCMKKLELILSETFKLERTFLISCMTPIRKSLIQEVHLVLKSTYSHSDDVVTHETIDILSLLPTTLRSLILKVTCPPMTFDYSKIKYFPHLTNLKVDPFVGPLNTTLEAIFKYLVKLKSVYIDCKKNVPEAEMSPATEPGENPTGSPILTKRFALKDLESIDVQGTGTVAMDIINGIKCPKLWRFGNLPKELSEMTLVKLFQDNPCLSYVVQGHEMNAKTYLNREKVMMSDYLQETLSLRSSLKYWDLGS